LVLFQGPSFGFSRLLEGRTGGEDGYAMGRNPAISPPEVRPEVSHTDVLGRSAFCTSPSIEINPINFNVLIFAVGIKYLCEDRKFASIRICSSSEVNLRQHNPDATSRPNAAPSKV
jgi:hypothetical protein